MKKYLASLSIFGFAIVLFVTAILIASPSCKPHEKCAAYGQR